MSPSIEFHVSVILFREGDGWVAQCLEFDLAAQGSTVEQARRRFEQTLIANILLDVAADRQPLVRLSPAPKEFWDKWDASGEFSVGESPVRVPSADHKPVPRPRADVRIHAAA